MEENTNNAITDTMMTSTPEQRNEAEAIFRFMSKLKANKPGAKLEEQLETLDSFFTADETSFNIEELDPYVVAFIEKICKDFCEAGEFVWNFASNHDISHVVCEKMCDVFGKTFGDPIIGW